ncbi:terminase family protein [bacterium]|nr:terminase family protein [bacterium]
MINLFANYRPHAGQRELHAAGTRFVAVCAGVRSGKTYGAAREFLRRVFADRFWKRGPLHYWAVAPTYDLCTVAEREILAVLRAASPRLLKAYSKTERRIELLGGIVIEMKSAHRPEWLVGVGLDGLWIDEAARVDPDAWKGQLRMRLSDREGFGVFSTTPLARNWFHEEIWRAGMPGDAKKQPSYTSVHFTTAQNTALPHLAREVEAARLELPARYFAREYLASFDAFVGQIYEEFDRRVHLATPADLPAAFAETRVGVDWGYRNPGAMIVVARDGDGTWWVLDEIVRAGLPIRAATDAISNPRTNAEAAMRFHSQFPIRNSEFEGASWLEIACVLAEKYHPSMFLCDPSRPEHIRALRAEGLPARAAKNEVAAGIQTVATLLHVPALANMQSDHLTISASSASPREQNSIPIGPRLRVSERCTHLLSELPAYRWRNDDAASEEPEKRDDHALDALRYALHHNTHRPAFW